MAIFNSTASELGVGGICEALPASQNGVPKSQAQRPRHGLAGYPREPQLD